MRTKNICIYNMLGIWYIIIFKCLCLVFVYEQILPMKQWGRKVGGKYAQIFQRS